MSNNTFREGDFHHSLLRDVLTVEAALRRDGKALISRIFINGQEVK